VPGDVDDPSSLIAAVKGADVVFATTAFSEAFVRASESDLEKLASGQTLREWCYELELQEGKNIADAVATVDELELFIWSTLSDASKLSGGKYKGVLHFDSKAKVVEYIKERYPEVGRKMSLLQLGLFVTNWKWGQGAVPVGEGMLPFIQDLSRDFIFFVWRNAYERRTLAHIINSAQTTASCSVFQGQATCRSRSSSPAMLAPSLKLSHKSRPGRTYLLSVIC
jgi:hypothetical protein